MKKKCVIWILIFSPSPILPPAHLVDDWHSKWGSEVCFCLFCFSHFPFIPLPLPPLSFLSHFQFSNFSSINFFTALGLQLFLFFSFSVLGNDLQWANIVVTNWLKHLIVRWHSLICRISSLSPSLRVSSMYAFYIFPVKKNIKIRKEWFIGNTSHPPWGEHRPWPVGVGILKGGRCERKIIKRIDKERIHVKRVN
jgi:hypothetical protein